MKKPNKTQHNGIELAKLRLSEEISSRFDNLDYKINNEIEKLKFEYLNRIIFQINLLELKDDVKFHEFINYILNKENRDDIEINILVTYLIYLDEVVEMLQSSHDDLIQVLKSVAENLRSEFLKANTLVFRQGEYGDKFYLIVQGSVVALIAEEVNDSLSEDEYFMYLIKLRYYNELDLLKKCLNLNNSVFPIREIELELWLKDTNRSEKRNLRNGIPKNLHSTLQSYINSLVDQSRNNYNDSLSPDTYINNTKYELDPNNFFERKKVKIFQYKKLVDLKTGMKFGDHALLPQFNQRTATVITTQDTILAVLKKDVFEKCVAESHDKIRQATTNFFIHNCLFKGIDRNTFHRNYYNYFVLHHYVRGDFIFKEDEESNYIYFLRKGEYELNFSKSLLEINKIIKYHNISLFNEAVENDKLEENEKFRHFMNKKMYIKFSIVNTEDIYGFDDIVLDNKMVINLKCISPTGEIFLCEKKLFNDILSHSISVKMNTNKFIQSRLDYFINRLIYIKKQKTKLFFDQQRNFRETNIIYKIKDERHPEIIEHNLISKNRIIKDVITTKRKLQNINCIRNYSQKTDNRNILTRKSSQEDFKNRLKEKNLSLMQNKDNHSFNLLESSRKQFNSSIFNKSSNRNNQLIHKTSLFSSNQINPNNEDKVKNLGLSSLESSKLVLPTKNLSKTDRGIYSTLKSVVSSTSLHFKNTSLFEGNLSSKREPIRSLNTLNNSLTHIPYLPTRHRYLYDFNNLVSSNLELENKKDSEIIKEVQNSNMIALTNRTGVSRSVNFNVYTPVDCSDLGNKINSQRSLSNNKNEKTVVVNSTFTDTLYNMKFKTMIVNIKVKDIQRKKS